MAFFKRKYNKTVCPDNSDDKMRYEVANLQGVGARNDQQDSFTFMNILDEEQYDRLGFMFAVCDGMGGMTGGKCASETAIGSLREFFTAMDRSGKISEQLKEAVFDASEKITSILGGDGGSTVVVGIVFHEKLHFVSVGDSFLFLYRNGQIYRLNTLHTVCHSKYMENIEKRSTETASCRQDPEAAALSQFLGMTGISYADATVRPLNLHKGDILIACSDGVGDVVTNEELLEAAGWQIPSEICKRLEEHIIGHAKFNQDNYTALVVRCK